MNKKKQTTQPETYVAPVLELHEFGVEQGFANSPVSDYLEIKGGDYTEGPGLDGYNDLEF